MKAADFLKMNAIDKNFELPNESSSVFVDTYFDEKNKKSYQVDTRKNKYRIADNLNGKYGDWIELEKD